MAQIYPCSPLQGWGLAKEELPFCDFSRGSRRGSQALPTHTAQAAVDLAFSPRGRKSVQNHPSPTVSKSRGAQHSGSVAVRRTELCCTAPDDPIPSLGTAVKPLQLLPRAVLPSPGNTTTPTTPTDEESKAQRGWEICLRSHSPEAAELGCKPRSGSLPQHHSTTAPTFRGVLALVCGQPHVTINLLVCREGRGGECAHYRSGAGWWYSFSHHLCTPVPLTGIPHLPTKPRGSCTSPRKPSFTAPACRDHSVPGPLCSSSRALCAHYTPVRGSRAHMPLCQGPEAAPLKC